MMINKVSAFSYNNTGGNPAGVVICDEMPDDSDMLKIASELNYSETAFMLPQGSGWRIRYFSPEMEVPFCGHATIASGFVLGNQFGEGEYPLFLNDGTISVSSRKNTRNEWAISLQSPSTFSEPAPLGYVEDLLTHFNLTMQHIHSDFPVLFASAGAKHLILVLKNKSDLDGMKYDFEKVKTMMQEKGLITINLLWKENSSTFHSRNPFPPGGVYEDSATGAAAAALGGYLRDIKYDCGGRFDVYQGEVMKSLSHLKIMFDKEQGTSVRVSGTAHFLVD